MRNRYVALLTNMVAPYRSSVFHEISQTLMPEMGLEVWACVPRESDRQWNIETAKGFTVRYISGFSKTTTLGNSLRHIHVRWGVLWALIARRPACVIIGDASLTSYLTAFACWVLRVPYLVWNEILPQTKLRSGVSAQLRGSMIKHAAGGIASGEGSAKFLSAQGLPDNRISRAINTADTREFEAALEKSEDLRREIRSRLEVDKDLFLLVIVGQLIPRKRVLELMEAVAETESCSLIIIGDGPLRLEIDARAAKSPSDKFHVIGNVDRRELARFICASDGLAIISDDEPWGMVVNEALFLGRPVLAADVVGAALELVSHETGMLVATNLSDLSNKLSEFIEKPFDAAMCRKAAQRASVSRCAEGFVRAINMVCP